MPSESALAVLQQANPAAGPGDLLKAAAQDAAKLPPEEKAKVAEEAAATLGLLPAADRKWVFVVGLALIAVALVGALVAVLALVPDDKAVPNELWILISSVVTGVLGGLFGFSVQKK